MYGTIIDRTLMSGLKMSEIGLKLEATVTQEISGKKPYCSPTLSHFGLVRELTASGSATDRLESEEPDDCSNDKKRGPCRT
jgi:hypothetical protein